MGPGHSWLLGAALATAPTIGGLPKNVVLYAAVGVGALVAIGIVAALLRKPKSEGIDPEAGMTQDLEELPPPPAQKAPRPLTLQGLPVRVRLVVLAPVGRKVAATDDEVEPMLDKVVRGLGQAARHDQPQVKAWPLGMSNVGFTPMFFRRMQRPQPAGRPSNWILLAGQARAGGDKVLLGLALWSEAPTTMGNIAVKPDEWTQLLQVQVAR
jgi:hypothetical protein